MFEKPSLVFFFFSSQVFLGTCAVHWLAPCQTVLKKQVIYGPSCDDYKVIALFPSIFLFPYHDKLRSDQFVLLLYNSNNLFPVQTNAQVDNVITVFIHTE